MFAFFSVWSGPGRRRFEFMRLPGESKEELREKTWQLLEEYGIDGKSDKARLFVLTKDH